MKNQIITIAISVVISVTTSLFLFPNVSYFGSTVTETASSDTLNTFRTNVNSSLTSLQAFASSTSLIGIMASTSPLGNIGIGTGNATSSISRGKYCDVAKDEAGRLMYITLSTSTNTVFSTSTTSCL